MIKQEMDYTELATAYEARLSEIEKLEFSLRERKKELRCLIELSEVLSNKDTKPEHIFPQIAELLSNAFQFPEKTGVKILWRDHIYRTSNFQENNPLISDSFQVGGQLSGKVEICFTGKTGAEINPFLPEELDLVAVVTRQVSHFLEKQLYYLALKENESLYHSIIAASPDVITITDLQGNILFASSKAFEMFSAASHEDFFGHNLLEYINPSDHERAISRITDMLNGKMAGAEEYIGIRSNGEQFDIEVNGAFVQEASDRPVRMLFVTRDISGRKRTERKLQESEQSYKLLFDESPDGLLIVREGIIIDCNKTATTMLGRQRENVIGSHIHQFAPEIQPNGRKSVEYAEEFVRETMLQRRSSFELLHSKQDGSTFLAQVDLVLIDSDEQVSILVIWRDITEKKILENELQKFRMLVDKANYGNAIASPEGTIVYCNQAFAGMHGLTIDELTGKSYSLLHASEHMESVNEALNEARKEGGFQAKEIWRIKKDGTVFPSLMNAMPFDQQGVSGYIWATAIDITKRKATEEALKASEQRLNYAQELAKMGNWEHDFRSNTLSGSKNYQRLLGLHPEEEAENLYQHFISHVHPEDISRIRYLQTYKYVQNQTISINIRIILPDGSIRWLQNNVVPVFEDEVLVGLRGVNIDITEKKEYEDKLKKWNLAIEQSPVSIMITDLEANIQYVNPAFERITGYTSAEIISKNAGVLKSGKTSKITYKALWRTIKSGGNWHSEIRNKRKNGDIYWESISITPITDENGMISNYLAIKQDISERKRIDQEILNLNTNLEEKIRVRTRELESFFSVALDLLCIADMSGKFIKVNKSWETLLGYPTSELLKRKFLDFVHPDDIPITLDMMKMLKGNVPIIKFINRYRTYDGQYRFIEWRSVPVGKLIYAAARDVTERIQHEEDLRHARSEAEKANNAKSEFLSRMSHELRTPLNSILGFAQLLEMGELSTAHRKGVNHIIKSGKHLLELINEVLDISRIEAGRMNLLPEPVELHGLLHETVDSLEAQASNHSVQIEIIDSPSMALSVMADRQRLRQVILNLITNAIKYNHQGGKVWITAEPKMSGSDTLSHIRIEVSDNGPGIPGESLSKLFTPFERIGADNTDIVGTGLGLAVVKTLTEAMEGILGVESTPNERTTFWIELPNTADLSDQAWISDNFKY